MPDTLPSVFRRGASVLVEHPLVNAFVQGKTAKFQMKKKRFHAKDASYCIRKSVMLCNVDETIMANGTASSALYTSIGTAFHETICDGFEKFGIMRLKEMRMDEMGLNIGGYIDAILEPTEGDLRVCEIKSCGQLPGAPKQDHVAQAVIYALSTGLKHPILFYASRSVATYNGTVLLKEFEVPTSDEVLYEMAFNISAGHFYLEEKLAPAIPSHLSKSLCHYCPLLPICWEDSPNFMKEASEDIEAMKRVLAKAAKHADFLMETFGERKIKTEKAVNDAQKLNADKGSK